MGGKFKVLVLDGVSPRGVEILSQVKEFEVVVSKALKEDELCGQIADCAGLVVRSATKVTRKALEKAGKLRVVGRAGVGVDNVDVGAATERGVVVMNTPGGNTISTAEHAFSLLLSVARKIPQAHASMREGRWDRKSYEGVEINNKTLGIIGMGRIGSEVARRAIAFGMRVRVYDPYLSLSKARSLQVELFEKLEEMVPECDFLTLHLPMTAETKGILDAKMLGRCRRGVRVVNCARGGLVDEKALREALESGQVAGAALDVYEQEPPPEDYALRQAANLVMTPHLGASTAEAQESVGIEVAEAVRDFLLQGTVRNAVNIPNVDGNTLAAMRPFLELGEKMGLFLAQLGPTRCNRLEINYTGRVKEQNTTLIGRAALKGYLRHAIGPDVNEINVMVYASNLGLDLSETQVSEEGDYSELICLKAKGCDGSEAEISGTLFGTQPRIVRINGQYLEAAPQGVLLALENNDRPGMVGQVGTLLGKHQVNIASMTLGRSQPGARALSVLNLDSLPGAGVLSEIAAVPGILSVRVIRL